MPEKKRKKIPLYIDLDGKPQYEWPWKSAYIDGLEKENNLLKAMVIDAIVYLLSLKNPTLTKEELNSLAENALEAEMKRFRESDKLSRVVEMVCDRPDDECPECDRTGCVKIKKGKK